MQHFSGGLGTKLAATANFISSKWGFCMPTNDAHHRDDDHNDHTTEHHDESRLPQDDDGLIELLSSEARKEPPPYRRFSRVRRSHPDPRPPTTTIFTVENTPDRSMTFRVSGERPFQGERVEVISAKDLPHFDGGHGFERLPANFYFQFPVAKDATGLSAQVVHVTFQFLDLLRIGRGVFVRSFGIHVFQ